MCACKITVLFSSLYDENCNSNADDRDDDEGMMVV